MAPTRKLPELHALLATLALALIALPLAGATPPIRGLAVDPARLPESPEYYRRLIDFAAEWGFNAILFRLTDDQGSALRFERHPELITHQNALTTAEARELAEYGEARGVRLIPEVESFGHAGYITRSAAHRELTERDPRTGRTVNTLIPVHPKTRELLRDLYEEVAAIFPSPYLHAGCDEVTWGGSDLSQQALATRGRAEIWADHVNALQREARRLGKELMIWGDHPLRGEPEILKYLSREVILVDWDYATTSPAAIRAAARRALDNGFRILGSPALGWCRWGLRVGEQQLRNIDVYADTYLAIEDPNNLGLIATNWVPTRYLQNSIWDGLAYAGVVLGEGSAAARSGALARFVERHYGAAWSPAWEEMFRGYYEATPYRRSCTPASLGPVLPQPWDNGEALLAVLLTGRASAQPFAELLRQVEALEPSVQNNREDFVSFRRTVEYLQHIFWRDNFLLQQSKTLRTPAAARNLIAAIARRDQALLESLRADWDRGRPPDSPMKSRLLAAYSSEDLLLAQLTASANFSAQLAANPDEFLLLLEAAGVSYPEWVRRQPRRAPAPTAARRSR